MHRHSPIPGGSEFETLMQDAFALAHRYANKLRLQSADAQDLAQQSCICLLAAIERNGALVYQLSEDRRKRAYLRTTLRRLGCQLASRRRATNWHRIESTDPDGFIERDLLPQCLPDEAERTVSLIRRELCKGGAAESVLDALIGGERLPSSGRIPVSFAKGVAVLGAVAERVLDRKCGGDGVPELIGAVMVLRSQACASRSSTVERAPMSHGSPSSATAKGSTTSMASSGGGTAFAAPCGEPSARPPLLARPPPQLG